MTDTRTDQFPLEWQHVALSYGWRRHAPRLPPLLPGVVVGVTAVTTRGALLHGGHFYWSTTRIGNNEATQHVLLVTLTERWRLTNRE